MGSNSRGWKKNFFVLAFRGKKQGEGLEKYKMEPGRV